MASAVILTQETFDRVMKVVTGWEEGKLPIIEGAGIKIEEIGPAGMKLGGTLAPDCTGILAWDGSKIFCYDTVECGCDGGVIDGGGA